MTQEFDECEVLAETHKACLIRFDDGTEEWIPHSQIEDRGGYEEPEFDGLHWFMLTDWVCIKKGLIDEGDGFYTAGV